MRAGPPPPPLPQSYDSSNEYSPPWELKQTVLLQSIQSSSSSLKPSPPHQPLQSNTNNNNVNSGIGGTSGMSTLTNSQNVSALSSLFNQFSRTRLSTRSNTSSSSSTRSSTSSLSTNSPPSLPAPPLPPSIPPPPPPTNDQQSKHRCVTGQQVQLSQQSPRLSHHHFGATNSSSNLSNPNSNNSLLTRGFSNVSSSLVGANGFAIVPGINAMSSSSCSSCSLKKNNHTSNGSFMPNNNNLLSCNVANLHSNSSYLNESQKFCSWGSNSSSNTNSFENANCVDGNFIEYR